MKISLPKRAIITIVACLLIVGFFESGRIQTIALGADDSPIKKIGLTSALVSANIKSYIKNQNIINIIKSGASSTHNTNTPNEPTISQYIPPSPPYRVIIAGDSFIAERIGPKLEKAMSTYASTTVRREGIYSTGLSRQDYFDWEKEIQSFITQHNPNIAIVMFGANDAQGAIDRDDIPTPYTAPEWDGVYAARVKTFAEIMTNQKITVFWIGIPIARDANYRAKMQRLNAIYEREISTLPQAVFVPTWDILTDENGNYTAYLPDKNGIQKKARESDGIHPTDFGADIITEKVMEEITQRVPFQKPPALAINPAASEPSAD